MIVSLDEILQFIGISNQYFSISAVNDNLMLAYDAGASTSVDIPDGTYDGTSLASALKTAIDAALTCVSTVTWNSTTRKFTLAVGAGHTLTYAHTGSEAGIYVGFNTNHAAALSISSDLAVGDPTVGISSIHKTSELLIQRICQKNFESQTYYEYYDGYNGNGDNYPFRDMIGFGGVKKGLDVDYDQFIQLNHFPVTAVRKFCIGTEDVVTIYNTNEYSTASVSVNATGVVLENDSVEDSTSTFAGYATLALLVAHINAIGLGWVAEVLDDDKASWKSSELLERYGANALDSSYVYLAIPAQGKTEFHVNAKLGRIYYKPGIPPGYDNIYVVYTAGYATADIPENIKTAIMMLTQYLFNKYKYETLGVDTYTLGSMGTTFSPNAIPKEIMRMLPARFVL